MSGFLGRFSKVEETRLTSLEFRHMAAVMCGLGEGALVPGACYHPNGTRAERVPEGVIYLLTEPGCVMA